MQMKKLTPVLVVKEIEASLEFWVGRLGFEKTMEMPFGDKLGFVGISRDQVEVMLQSEASGEADLPGVLTPPAENSIGLYLEVDSIDSVQDALGDGVEVVVPRRKTFYGMDEIAVLEPGGHIVIFASRA